ncbi:MAG: glycosyltransferase family 4 protein [Thermoplasmata archaeon]|nr:glycosyltransferase family 4 protein [Thermoplasmata archaeon]
MVERPIRALFAGASMEPDWEGGEPVFADLLERGLKELGVDVVREGSRRGLAGFAALAVVPYDLEPHRLLQYRRRLRAAHPDVVLAFYDYDCSLIIAAHQEGIPVVACTQIYWPTCPIGTHYIEGSGVCYEPEFGKCLRHIARSPVSPNLGIPLPGLPPPLGFVLYSKLWVRHRALSLADAIAPNSEFMAGVLRTAGYDRVHPIYNGVDVGLFHPTPWNEPVRQVLYPVARSGQERKGYPHFAELAKTIRKDDPSVRFKVLNHKSDELMDGAPYLTRTELAEEFRRSYLAVVPGLWDEPFGLVAAEAMAAGRPVVAYATGGLPEIIEDGVSGILVPRGDVQALTEAVRGLLKDPERARRLGEGARARVEAKFRYERTAAEYLALIQELLNRGALPAPPTARAG